MRAKEIAEAREQCEAKRLEAERRRQAAEAEKHAVRGSYFKQRDAGSVWRQIEQEIDAVTRLASPTTEHGKQLMALS